MKKKLLLIAVMSAIWSIESCIYAQENTINQQIAEKEASLSNATKSSRQNYNQLKFELIELYTRYQTSLTQEINSVENRNLKAEKEKELERVNLQLEKLKTTN